MNKAGIVARIAEEATIPKSTAAKAFEAIFSNIAQAIKPAEKAKRR